MKYSDDNSISDLSISAETEVLPYCFEPEAPDSELPGHSDDVNTGELEGLSSERVVKQWMFTYLAGTYLGLSTYSDLSQL